MKNSIPKIARDSKSTRCKVTRHGDEYLVMTVWGDFDCRVAGVVKSPRFPSESRVKSIVSKFVADFLPSDGRYTILDLKKVYVKTTVSRDYFQDYVVEVPNEIQ